MDGKGDSDNDSTLATFVHANRTQGDDYSFCVVEYEGNRVAMVEDSWAKGRGVDDRCEIYDHNISFPYKPPVVEKPIDLWKRI